jgi:hypothetical protein
MEVQMLSLLKSAKTQIHARGGVTLKRGLAAESLHIGGGDLHPCIVGRRVAEAICRIQSIRSREVIR